MLNQFHKKMAFLYTFTTGIIFSCVLLIILIYNEKLMNLRNEEAFQSAIWTLVSTIQSEHNLSHLWLARIEAENNFIIHIEENGIPLLYKGSWEPDTDRDTLIESAKKYAAKNNINTSSPLVSQDIQQSKTFRLKGEAHDDYQCIIINISNDKGYLNLILLHSLKPLYSSIKKQRLLFALLNVMGIFALFLVSWIFVKKSLRPIRENKEKQDAFFAAASHELRSPIAVIQTAANAITANPPKANTLISTILSECRRLSRLTEDILTLSRSVSSGWSADLKSLDLDTLLLNAFETFEPICRENSIRLSLSLPDKPLPAISGDYDRLMQLITILIDNAISHSSNAQGNHIIIKAEHLHRKIQIQIIDHGIGIPDSQKPLIFDHFYRGDISRSDKTHFGLGLGIALELAKLHHGKLAITDTNGGGATFILTLPCTT